MKTIHKILIVSAFIGITAAVVVSCNKESNSNQTKEQNLPSAKIGSPTDAQLLLKSVKSYTVFCIEAYRADSTSLINACQREDDSLFYAATNIPRTLRDSIVRLACVCFPDSNLQQPGVYYTDTCQSCSQPSYSRILNDVRELYQLTTIIKGYDPTFNYDFPVTVSDVDGCWHDCRSSYPPADNNLIFCLQLCYMDLGITGLFAYAQLLME